MNNFTNLTACLFAQYMHTFAAVEISDGLMTSIIQVFINAGIPGLVILYFMWRSVKESKELKLELKEIRIELLHSRHLHTQENSTRLLMHITDPEERAKQARRLLDQNVTTPPFSHANKTNHP